MCSGRGKLQALAEVAHKELGDVNIWVRALQCYSAPSADSATWRQ